MPATYEDISNVLTASLLKWAADGDVTLANNLWDRYRSNKITEFDAVKLSPNNFAALAGNSQQALVDLVTGLRSIGIRFEPSASASR
jgi:hypothetical protein